MTIFLTGASGLLGHALAKAFAQTQWKVHGTSHRQRPSAKNICLHQVDLTKSEELNKLLKDIKPDAIVNAASLSVPADCEKDPLRSKALNITLPTEIARIANDQDLDFIHFSTDMVFDGKAGNYLPDSPTNPTNLYGEHKRESEIRVHDLAPNSRILRLPLLMGNSLSGTRSVHETLWNCWSQGMITPLFEDEWRNPVSVTNVALLVEELLVNLDITGLFHWAGGDRLNRWELGQSIAQKLNVPLDQLQRTRAGNLPHFKDRPLNLTLDSSKLKALVQTEPAPFEIQLEEIVTPTS